MVSCKNTSLESAMFNLRWEEVPDALIPEVALVELPPKKEFLSMTKTFAPCSNAVCAAERPVEE